WSICPSDPVPVRGGRQRWVGRRECGAQRDGDVRGRRLPVAVYRAVGALQRSEAGGDCDGGGGADVRDWASHRRFDGNLISFRWRNVDILILAFLIVTGVVTGLIFAHRSGEIPPGLPARLLVSMVY